MTPLAFIQMLGPFELSLILVLVLMLFGVGRLPQVMRQLGRGISTLRSSLRLEHDDAD